MKPTSVQLKILANIQDSCMPFKGREPANRIAKCRRARIFRSVIRKAWIEHIYGEWFLTDDGRDALEGDR